MATAHEVLSGKEGGMMDGSAPGCLSRQSLWRSRRWAGLLVLLGVLGLLLPDTPTARADGELDLDFGTGGKVITGFGSDEPFEGYAGVNGLALQADGKIIAAGDFTTYSVRGGRTVFALTRYLPDGSLDRSFGAGGKVTTEFGGEDEANAVALQGDGKIVAAGGHCNTIGRRYCTFALARYLPDGNLDTSFGAGGRVTTDFGVVAWAETVAIQRDGKIVAAGVYRRVGRTDTFALVRYLPDGSPDKSFGAGGKVATEFGGDAWAFAVALQGDGKIVAAGFSEIGDRTAFALVRYRLDGSLDTGFGAGGRVTTDFGEYALAPAVALQGDGKIIAAGYAGARCTDRCNFDFALTRYHPDGSPDGSFGTGGKVITDFGGDDAARAIAFQSDGKIIAVGDSEIGDRDGFALARYLPDGSLDGTFGAGGRVTTYLGEYAGAFAVALQGDGKIVVGGYSDVGDEGGFAFTLVRYRGSSPAP
jgi:uncharacterized delta-60 repeat protein